MEDSFKYLRWLEDRWEVHKHDHFYSSAEREEKRVEEILEMLKGLVRLSERRVEVPYFPPWEPHW
jgi:hypothetical protein